METFEQKVVNENKNKLYKKRNCDDMDTFEQKVVNEK